ncbi:transcription initiation factor TFIID subunit 4b [Tanacetum coccineum]
MLLMCANIYQNRSHLSTPHGLEHATGGPVSLKDDTFEAMSSRPGSITAQLERQNAAAAAAANSSLESGGNAKTSPTKPIVGQKKPLEASVIPLSKKQKVVGELADQSIEQLNDVTAVTGVNLREEEEQLFSGATEDSRVSEASRKTSSKKEEESCFAEKSNRKKLGLKSAQEEWEKKHAIERTPKSRLSPEGSSDGDEGRSRRRRKAASYKEEDYKMRTTAANVAARAAVGGDDMLSKWQLMAKQARQKREGGADSASTSQPSLDVGPKPVSTSERTLNDNSDTEKTYAPATVTVTLG